MSRRVAPEFINKVKQEMKSRFGSQEELADAIPCAKSTVANFLRGIAVHKGN
jgi:hypothetical protein